LVPANSATGSWLDPSGYDACEKIKGLKRHILVDTLSLMLNVVVHPADIQNRDGGCAGRDDYSRSIERIFADGAYAGRKMAMAAIIIHPPRHPHHDQATCCKWLAMNPNFPDGL
jgi:Transposase DDE domain